MFAASGTGDGVWITGLGALALVLSTTIPAWLASRRARSDARDASSRAAEASDRAATVESRIGTPNGHGDLTTMLAKSLENQGEFEAEIRGVRTELARIAERQHADGVEIRYARAQGESHALLDRRWFRVLFEHAGVPPHVIAEYEAEAKAADAALDELPAPRPTPRS